MNLNPLVNELGQASLQGLRGSATLVTRQASPRPAEPAAFKGALNAARHQDAKAASDVHTVQAGENLWRIVEARLLQSAGQPSGKAIAREVANVARANGIKDPNLILVGQRIDLSSISGQIATAAKSEPPPSATDSAPTSTLGARKFAQLVMDSRTSLLRKAAKTKNWEPLIDFKALGGPPHAVPATKISSSAEHASAEHASAEHASAEPVDLSRLLHSIVRPTPVSASMQKPESPWARLLSKPAHLTSGFGMRKDPFTGSPQFHDGVDLAVPAGTRIRPYAAGTVVKSGWESGYGKVVKVRHRDGTETVYGHNLTNLVRVGDQVNEQTTLGLVGSSGRSTGPHLHFEVRRNGRSANPVPYLTRRYSR